MCPKDTGPRAHQWYLRNRQPRQSRRRVNVHRQIVYRKAVWLADFAVSLASFPSPPLPPPPPSPTTSTSPYSHHLPIPINPSPSRLPPSFSPPPPASVHPLSRLLSSSAGGSSMVVVGSAESFASILSKVQDEKLSAVFYYTAVWCGPCRAIAPVIAKLSSQYPKIPVYKVDIDMDGLGGKLSGLKIFSVPTFHFYHKGQKTSGVVGADVKKLEAAMESLHKQQ